MYAQMKSVLAAGCVLAASTLGVAAFEAVTVEPSELREGAAWDFAPIVVLPPGSIVEVLNCDRSWCEVGIEDYDGFLPRGVLDLGGNPVPFYAFPPQVAAPALWHGRYYSRDHYRFESRARWRDRDDRRLYVLPPRVQPRPLPPPMRRIEPGIQPMPRQGQPPAQRVMPPAPLGQPPAQRVMPSPPPGQPPAQRVMPQPQPQPRQVQPQPQPQPRPQAQPQAPVQRQAPAAAPAPRAAPAPAAEKQKQKSPQ